MESGELGVLTAYLKAHPLIAAGLAALAVLLLGSLVRRLVRLALILAVIVAFGLYWTRREAQADWRAQAEALRRRATSLGQEALEKGKELLEAGQEELKRRAVEDQKRGE